MSTRSPRRGDASPVADPVRDRLSVLLAESGLSVSALARAVGVDRGTVADWLSGEKPIPESRRAWIARVQRLDVSAQRVSIVLTR